MVKALIKSCGHGYPWICGTFAWNCFLFSSGYFIIWPYTWIGLLVQWNKQKVCGYTVYDKSDIWNNYLCFDVFFYFTTELNILQVWSATWSTMCYRICYCWLCFQITFCKFYNIKIDFDFWIFLKIRQHTHNVHASSSPIHWCYELHYSVKCWPGKLYAWSLRWLLHAFLVILVLAWLFWGLEPNRYLKFLGLNLS